MAKICVRDCFIVDYRSFKKGEIIRDKEALKRIENSSNFENCQEKEEVKEKIVEEKPTKEAKKRNRKKTGGEK